MRRRCRGVVDYVAVGGHRSFPCLPTDVLSPHHHHHHHRANPLQAAAASYKSMEATWFDERGQQLAVAPPSGDRTHHAYAVDPDDKNLTLRDARTDDTARYVCVVSATGADDRAVTVMNVLRVNGQQTPHVILMSLLNVNA